MLTSYTYGMPGSDRKCIIALEEDEGIPPLRVEMHGETWVRITDTVLTCEPALYDQGGRKGLVMTKCGGGWECHRTVLGQCMCGLHDHVRITEAPA
jgi:hypothetical protein